MHRRQGVPLMMSWHCCEDALASTALTVLSESRRVRGGMHGTHSCGSDTPLRQAQTLRTKRSRRAPV